MNERRKKWNRLEQMEQIRPCLIWNGGTDMEQTKSVGLFHQNSSDDLRKRQRGTDGTDETSFSYNLIKSIYKVVNKGLKDKNRGIKNLYRFFARLFRSICSTNKRSCLAVI